MNDVLYIISNIKILNNESNNDQKEGFNVETKSNAMK